VNVKDAVWLTGLIVIPSVPRKREEADRKRISRRIYVGTPASHRERMAPIRLIPRTRMIRVPPVLRIPAVSPTKNSLAKNNYGVALQKYSIGRVR
jgi:hypothetical protein